MLEYTLTFAEMRDKWIAGYRDNDTSFLANSHNADRYRSLKNEWISAPDWYGGNPDDTLRYFQDGFQTDMLDCVDTSAMPVRKRAKPKYNDCEGDFRYDLFASGDDNYFVQWSQRESIPGITVEFSTGFLADVPASTIAEYMRWLCAALIAIESAGIDAAIYATSYGVRRFQTSSDSLKWRMEVKREGERNDFLNWSALFSPASYRQLGFFTLILAAESLGHSVNPGMGATQSDSWNVTFEKETRTLKISHVSKGYATRSFPEKEMTDKLISALAESRG